MAAACARAGDLTWTEHGEGPAGETGTVAARPEAWGDVILARQETPTSYHLAVAIDDALQGVTEVVRGRDLFWSTSVHRLLQVLLGLPQPAYRHHRLVLDSAGQKLSKSTGATGLRELRAGGATAADIRRLVGLGLIAVRPAGGDRRRKNLLRRDSASPAVAWWGGRGRGNHGAEIALTAHQTAAEKAADEKARPWRCRRQGAQARGRRCRARHRRGGPGRVRA